MSERFFRAINRVEGLPEWLRPPIYGAAFVWFLMGLKGAFVLGPLLVVGILLTSEQPVADLGFGLRVLVLATAGGAAAGTAYSLVGRWLQRAPLVGPYLAGIVTVMPYMAAVTLIIRLSERRPLLIPPDGAEQFTVGVLTLVFGPVLGHMFFGDN